MGGLLRSNWAWELLAFALGGLITWFLLTRTQPAPAGQPAAEEERVLVGVGATSRPEARTADAAPPRKGPAQQTREATPAAPPAVKPASKVGEPTKAARPTKAAGPTEAVEPPKTEPVKKPEPGPVFSRRMDVREVQAPTLFEDGVDEAPSDVPEEVVPEGKYGPGSVDAVPHQAPPDGFTIKGNGGSMLFHTPDSPYYGRTKPEVWFRTEADAERAGFTKYVRKPRRTPKTPR